VVIAGFKLTPFNITKIINSGHFETAKIFSEFRAGVIIKLNLMRRRRFLPGLTSGVSTPKMRMNSRKSVNLVQPIKGNRSGFTMVESLIALLVLMIGFMAAVSMNTTALRSETTNELQFQAVFLADSRIEEVRSFMPTFSGSSTSITEYFDRNGLVTNDTNAFFTRKTDITLSTPSSKTDEVSVEVTSSRSPLKITYVTLLDHMDE
jgi:Tfp pilus assembly protein PilV